MKKLLLDRTLLVICGIGSCVLLDPILSRGATTLSALIAPWDESVRMGVIILIQIAFWWGVASLGGFRIRDLWSRTTLRFPPVWICGVVAAALYSLITDNLRTPQQFHFENIAMSDMFCVLSAPVFVGLLNWVMRDSAIPDNLGANCEPTTSGSSESTCKTRSTDALPAIHEAPFESAESLIRWLQKEEPIQQPDQDCFKVAPIARRIARLLLDTPLRTIGLVGDYGVGKSSVLNLVEHYLNNTDLLELGANPTLATPRSSKKELIRCRVGAWGYKGTSAAQQILKEAIGVLSQNVDCLGLAALPSHYGSAITAVDAGWTKTLGGILGRQTEPVEILKKLDEVLERAKLRLVVFLEDLDRNPEEEELFGTVASLLDRLKSLRNVSFLLAMARRPVGRHDLLRICEHLEDIPNMPADSAMDVFTKFRKRCLTEFAEDQDCLKQDVRDPLLGDASSILLRGRLDLDRETGHTETRMLRIAKVANTPRLLKSTLRHSWLAWRLLHGELDFDNLVVANVLRNCLPDAFKFIVENIDRLQRVANSEGSRDPDDKDRSDLQADWAQFTRNASWDTASGGILISFLFPESLVTRSGDILVPQGLAQTTPTNYWSRYTAGEVVADDIRDQKILGALSAWQVNNEDLVCEQRPLATALLEVPGVADRVEHFGGLLDAEEIRALASQLFEQFLQGERKRPEGDFGRGEPPGFIQLWRLSMDHPSANHADWIADEIAKALPVSLRFANDLYYYWRGDSRKAIELKIRTPEVREEFVNRGKVIFGENPEALIRALEADCSYSVYQFAVLFSSTDQGGLGFDPQEWKWLADVLLDAVELDPQLVIPEVAALLVDSQLTRTGEHEHSFKKDITDALFGDAKERLMRNLAREIDLEPLDPVERGRVSFVWKYAENWLKPEEP